MTWFGRLILIFIASCHKNCVVYEVFEWCLNCSCQWILNIGWILQVLKWIAQHLLSVELSVVHSFQNVILMICEVDKDVDRGSRFLYLWVTALQSAQLSIFVVPGIIEVGSFYLFRKFASPFFDSLIYPIFVVWVLIKVDFDQIVQTWVTILRLHLIDIQSLIVNIGNILILARDLPLTG